MGLPPEFRVASVGTISRMCVCVGGGARGWMGVFCGFDAIEAADRPILSPYKPSVGFNIFRENLLFSGFEFN